MSNGTDEIKEIRKRLEEIERAVNELHKLVKDLTDSVKKQPAKEATEQAQGESVKAVTEPARVEPVKKVEPVKDTTDYAKWDSVWAAASYNKEEKVDSAEQAMGIAHHFFKEKGKTVALPIKAVRQNNVWLVEIDVGAVRLEIATVKVDTNTGNVLGYEITKKK